jgi:hypothetical protein
MDETTTHFKTRTEMDVVLGVISAVEMLSDFGKQPRRKCNVFYGNGCFNCALYYWQPVLSVGFVDIENITPTMLP